ncbi:MAG: acetyl-CoA carboxylase biotin carboxyl carrier protein [Lactobacillales bacterium]|jgi:acetyl-CoA carboxylase biotin carboxyl carrier protein|nr:acetyl-CoA carboxylase biotin carboxyl carrier protein [Lactobacillales bacterium]
MEKEQKQAITELAKILHDSNLSEIEYEANGIYVRVVGPNGAPVAAPIHVPAASTAQPASIPQNVPAKEPVKAGKHIVSPMVGVVYLTKDPKTPPYIQVGDKVSVGQTVCLIEAMKTFNPIKSTVAGTVTSVLVETGSPVEFDQPLFSVE